MDNHIELFFHCAQCIQEKPVDQSPREYSQVEVGWTKKGFQVWCKRHDRNIVAVDFKGQKVSYE